jgi:hypothetical protein
MLACALALTVAAHLFAVFPFDLKITHELQEEKNPVFAFAMEGLSATGDTLPGIVMVGAVFAYYIARRQTLEAVFILFTMSNFVLTSLIKVLVARPRPPLFFRMASPERTCPDTGDCSLCCPYPVYRCLTGICRGSLGK